MVNREKEKTELTALREEIQYHNYRYYILDEPEISDMEYDRLFKRLLQIEKRYPELIVPESPSQRVGAPIEGGFKTAKHSVPMLSLENGFSDKEIREFEERIKRLLARQGINSHAINYIVEPKMDGLAVDVFY